LSELFVFKQGCTERGHNARTPNHVGAPKNPKNVASTFFNAAHLPPKGLKFEHGAPNLFLDHGTI